MINKYKHKIQKYEGSREDVEKFIKDSTRRKLNPHRNRCAEFVQKEVKNERYAIASIYDPFQDAEVALAVVGDAEKIGLMVQSLIENLLSTGEREYYFKLLIGIMNQFLADLTLETISVKN